MTSVFDPETAVVSELTFKLLEDSGLYETNPNATFDTL